MSSERTVPLYYESCGKTECQSKVVSVEEAKDQKVANCHIVVLNETICYPQGGGQPSDTGVITKTADNLFNVSDTRITRDSETIQHFGQFSGPLFEVGDTVTVKIDEEKRLLHSRLHSGGHLIDACLKSLGFMDKWKATKGYHFPDGPYVEYKGEISDSELKSLKERIEEKAKELIAENSSIKIHLDVSLEEAQQICGQLDPMYLKASKLRLITINDYSVPCGGTHVETLSQLNALQVPKIKNTKGKQLIRVYYKLV
jgi:Ser-tRNA(Ala) deacylase AlaX